MLREHVIEVSLFDAKRTYADLVEILRFKLKTTKEFEGEPKLIWCINEDATRCVVLKIGNDKFILYTQVKNQQFPQDWAWIDMCFGHDRLDVLAKSDVKMGMQHLLDAAREVTPA